MINYPYYPNNNYQNYQNYYQPQQNQQPQQDERIWVQGEAGANAYLMAPNSFVRLWDSTAQVFYEKRSDASGRPYMETFDYSKHIVKDKEEENFSARFDAIEMRLKALEEVKHEQSNTDDTTVQRVRKEL